MLPSFCYFFEQACDAHASMSSVVRRSACLLDANPSLGRVHWLRSMQLDKSATRAAVQPVTKAAARVRGVVAAAKRPRAGASGGRTDTFLKGHILLSFFFPLGRDG